MKKNFTFFDFLMSLIGGMLTVCTIIAVICLIIIIINIVMRIIL